MTSMDKFTIRNLTRDEVHLIWEIERAEFIGGIYTLVEGKLVLKPEQFDLTSWPLGEPEIYAPILLDCFDRGGWFLGIFDGNAMVGVIVLANEYIGPERDSLQLKFMHVGRFYRGAGMGKYLFHRAAEEARRRGAKKLIISATPSESTIQFYLKLGCCLARSGDLALMAFEPDDIPMEYNIPAAETQPEDPQFIRATHNPKSS